MRARRAYVKIDRKWIGDIGLAVLLALPTAALTRPPTHEAQDRPTTVAPHLQLAMADRSPVEGRFTLRG